MDLTWKYSARYSPSAPVVPLELGGVAVDCAVDTGFSGGVMVTFPLFESLGLLSRLVPEEYQAVMPDSRRVPVYTAQEEVVVGPLRVRTLVHASPRLERKLVGRGFLRSVVATLNGPEERLSLS